MPPKPRHVYWDANVFLALFQKGDTPDRAHQRKHSILWLEAARSGRILIVTSALTLAEARRGENEPPLPGAEHATIRAFFKHSYIVVLPVDRPTAELAADYGERFNLKPRDAIHLATAVRAKVNTLFAWDGDFHRKKAMISAPLLIEKPEWSELTQLSLDTSGVLDDADSESEDDSI
jgi:predicted nucleic acid-binding protein